MALITTNRLFVDVDLNRSYSQFGTFNISSQPFFIQGDQCPVEINLVRQTGLQGTPFTIVTWPVGATFALKIGTTTAVATSTTTATTPAGPSAVTAVTTPYTGTNWQVNQVLITPDPLGGNFTINNGTSDTSPISVFATAARTSAGMTSTVDQWPLATASACPGLTGLISMKAMVTSSSNSLKQGRRPATILQKMQFPSVG